jgi:hypothetical protein
MVSAQSLQVATAADLFPRLRVLAENVLVVNVVFFLQVASCGGNPVLIQCRPVLSICHILLTVSLMLFKQLSDVVRSCG